MFYYRSKVFDATYEYSIFGYYNIHYIHENMYKITERNHFSGYFDIISIKLIDCKSAPPWLTDDERERFGDKRSHEIEADNLFQH